LADDPDEELFAGVAVEEAAIVGLGTFEVDALIRNLGGGFVVTVEGVVARCGRLRVRSVCAGDVVSLISNRRRVQKAAY
jgi:hypothetical protein